MNCLTKQQHRLACSVDLCEYLLRNHPDAVKQQSSSVVLRSDDHVSVKQGFHGFLNFKTGEHGNNVDFLMRFLGFDYPGAVLALIGDRGAAMESVVAPSKQEPRELVIPKPADGQFRQLFACLTARAIPVDVVQMLIDRGLVFQSEVGNNIVFVTPQRDYLEVRGTNSFADRRCRKRNECNRFCPVEHGWCSEMDSCTEFKPDPFHGCGKTGPDRFWFFVPEAEEPVRRIFVCEAAIDAVSLFVLHRATKTSDGAVYVSIGGVANQKAIDRIVRHENGREVILAVDNDAAGQECRDRNPALKFILPRGKDWNEDLVKEGSLNGQKR